MKHLIIDFETMGTKTKDCAMIDCSVFHFDTVKMLSDQPYNTRSIVDVKKIKLSMKDQVDNYGWVVYKDTIEFWKNQSAAARKHIIPSSSDVTVEKFTDEFISYIVGNGKIDYWWSRSNSFDPILLWRIFEAADRNNMINEYLKHWKVRDIRTYIDAKLDFPKVNGFVPISDIQFWEKVFVEHDSSWDVLADVLRFQAIVRAENDLEMIER